MAKETNKCEEQITQLIVSKVEKPCKEVLIADQLHWRIITW